MKMRILFLVSLFLTSPIYAQFNKYKSQTNLQEGKSNTEEAKNNKQKVEKKGDTASNNSINKKVPASDTPNPNLNNPPKFTNGNRNPGSLSQPPKEKKDNFFGRNKSIKVMSGKAKEFVNLNPETAFGPEVIESFDFPNTDILELTKHMQKLTGINLILDKDVKGKISILAPSAITVGDAWKAYLTALNLNGLTLVKSGAFYKIIQTRDVRYTPTKIYTGHYTPNIENYVMRIIPLKNVSSNEITRSFRPFMSRYGRIIDIKQTNTIIIHDTGANINRLVKLIKFLDVPGHEEQLQIIPVKHSSAQEIAKLLDTILKGTGSSRFKSGSKGQPQNISKIIAEPRTNSIIAMANADGAQELRSLIKKLDVKLVSKGGGKIHVYYLNYGDAETLSKTLSALVTGAGSAKVAAPGGSSGQSLFTDTVKITADKDNNALVVTASPTDYLTIKSVIDKLDIPRDQVYVEGMIMETQVDEGSNFGISLVGAYGSGNAQRAGFVPAGNSGLINLLTQNLTNLSGLFLGVGTGGSVKINVGGAEQEVNTVNGLIQAIATDNNTNVLATPQIMALDNQEAAFEVGETVPVRKSTNTANGSTQTSVEQQKIALTLKITPQINKVTRMIKLKIDQKIDDFSGKQTTAGDGVGTVTRSAVTTVIVRDQDTIAMGGLMRDKVTDTSSKVPLLGDIPVLGWLFKTKTKSFSKVNLILFLTPKIISPYEKVAHDALDNIIKRRALHLQNTLEKGDPFQATLEGLQKKAKKQGKGPLYNKDFTKKYKVNNRSGSKVNTQKNENENKTKATLEANKNAPNYKHIYEKVQKLKRKNT